MGKKLIYEASMVSTPKSVLNENDHPCAHMSECLAPVGGTVWEGLGGMA